MLASALTLSALALSVNAQLQPGWSRSFHGMAYSADGVLLPDCGAVQSQVTQDVLLLAQLTPRVRLYAADCNQTALVMQAIQDTNADITLWPAIFIPAGETQSTTEQVWQRQLDRVIDAFKTYGTAKIGGLTVGNEYLLLSYGDGTATDARGVAARTTLLNYIQRTNSSLTAAGITGIPIGTSDAGSAVTPQLCSGVDYVMANVHPWFGSVDAAGAAAWTTNFYKEFDTDVCGKTARNPRMFIAETGWPTDTLNASLGINGANAPASIAGLQTFLDTFPCSADRNGTEYFFFEFKDEPWKRIYDGVEPYWGLLNFNRTLKAGLTLPNCPVTSPTGGTVAQLNFALSGSSSSVRPSGTSGATAPSSSALRPSAAATGGTSSASLSRASAFPVFGVLVASTLASLLL